MKDKGSTTRTALMYGRGRWLALALTCGLLAAHAFAQDGGRLRPPGAITCDRNHLTSYTGNVLAYSRRASRVTLRIHTDEDTTESVTLRYSRSPARWFLLNGEAFRESDWRKIESSKGRLRSGMRVTAWVCDDGNKPVIDWHPSTGERRPRSTP